MRKPKCHCGDHKAHLEFARNHARAERDKKRFAKALTALLKAHGAVVVNEDYESDYLTGGRDPCAWTLWLHQVESMAKRKKKKKSKSPLA